MAIVKLESVQFTTLINIKGRSRSTSQITAKEAEQGELEMTCIDGHTLRIAGPLAPQLIPWARVKSAIEAPPELEPKAPKKGK
jgi:hypothetical protein